VVNPDGLAINVSIDASTLDEEDLSINVVLATRDPRLCHEKRAAAIVWWAERAAALDKKRPANTVCEHRPTVMAVRRLTKPSCPNSNLSDLP
jgi:hypothetical protein